MIMKMAVVHRRGRCVDDPLAIVVDDDIGEDVLLVEEEEEEEDEDGGVVVSLHSSSNTPSCFIIQDTIRPKAGLVIAFSFNSCI